MGSPLSRNRPFAHVGSEFPTEEACAVSFLLFGQIGVGKTFLGQHIAAEFGLPFHDADSDLPPSILDAIARRTPFTDAMRDEFTLILRGRIALLAAVHPRFCIAQALFYNRQRHVL